MKNTTETLSDSWALFKANVTKGWDKQQIGAAHDMYMVGACDLGRIIFGIMGDKDTNPHLCAAKLKKLEAELEGFKLEIAKVSLKKQVRDPSPEVGEAIENLKRRMEQ